MHTISELYPQSAISSGSGELQPDQGGGVAAYRQLPLAVGRWKTTLRQSNINNSSTSLHLDSTSCSHLHISTIF